MFGGTLLLEEGGGPGNRGALFLFAAEGGRGAAGFLAFEDRGKEEINLGLITTAHAE